MKPHPFIVAEMSGEHCGQIHKALKLVDLAANAGADAIKVQCFTPSQMAEPGVKIESGPWAGRDLLDLYRQTHTPRPWMREIFDRAKERGIVPFASVFHRDDVDFMETIGCPIYKISSFELQDTDLIEYAADTGKPMIISTGMAVFEDIDQAVRAAQFGGCMDLTLLKCTSAYPAPISQMNLAAMNTLRHGWDVDVGLSDHTIGPLAATMSIALGADIIEKHITLDHAAGGPDAAFSATEAEMTLFVQACRLAHEAMGTERILLAEAERDMIAFRRQPNGKRGNPKWQPENVKSQPRRNPG